MDDAKYHLIDKQFDLAPELCFLQLVLEFMIFRDSITYEKLKVASSEWWTLILCVQ